MRLSVVKRASRAARGYSRRQGSCRWNNGQWKRAVRMASEKREMKNTGTGGCPRRIPSVNLNLNGESESKIESVSHN